jgi:hypothetical protein
MPKFTKHNLPPVEGPRGDLDGEDPAAGTFPAEWSRPSGGDPFEGWVTPGPAPAFMSDGTPNPDAGEDSEAEAEEQKAHKQQEREWCYSLGPVSPNRSHFSGAELADEVARLAIDRQGYRAIKAEPEDRREILKQLRDAILAGRFDDPQGRLAVILRGGVFSSDNFRKAWGWYPSKENELRYLEAYVEPAYLTREACARFLRQRQYMWPTDWGDEPTIEAPAPKPRAGRSVEAKEKDTPAQTGASPVPAATAKLRKPRAIASEEAAKQEGIYRAVHAAASRLCDKADKEMLIKPMAEELAKLHPEWKISKETIRQILNGSYRPMKRHGIGRFVWRRPKERKKGG